MVLSALYGLLIIVIIFLRPKLFIYWFFLINCLEPVVISYFLNIPKPSLFIFYLGGVPFKSINQFGIILMTVLYPLANSFEKKITILNSFANSKRSLYMFIIGILIITLIKTLIYGDLSILLNLTTLLIFPTTLLNILYFFPTKKSAKKLFNFFFYSTLILFFLFVYFSVIPYFQKVNSIDFENRLRNYLYFGSNGTAAFLGIFLFMFLLKIKHIHSYFKKTLYYLIIFLLLISLLFTFTRTIFISLFLILLIDFFIFQNKKMNVIYFLAFSIVMFSFFGVEILNVLTRGDDSNTLIDLNTEGEDTFSFRIYKLWIPSIIEIFNNFIYILLGVEDRGFNEFLYRITGLRYANHNASLLYLVSSGVVSVILFLKFWFRLFKDFSKEIFSNSNVVNKRDIKLCFYSLLVFFISINFMSTYHVLFVLQVSIIINYSVSLSIKDKS
tara:strand:+ start:2099 stop:3424 length:1326 start_codon:yes stop_codon:yes gene_type:complete